MLTLRAGAAQEIAAAHPVEVTEASERNWKVNAPEGSVEVIPATPPGMVEPHHPPAGKPPLVPPLPLLIRGEAVLGPLKIYKASQPNSVLNAENRTLTKFPGTLGLMVMVKFSPLT